ncbi:queuosine precursor transporter [Flavobacteriaceae bacterium]|uniref:queuosine precursor transporter n=1 Tax=Candidatus Arcticimaribacter forsetii TaxID=2820661 RepID=UPI00207746FA|nr:queuosine precursor transporter [Candidatus Arcticimaribacter forsetii]MDA8699219.1 queuosine precursor transporter [Flavobacteriaceae bacterium]MDB2329268.1 queuosine precursor transporter [Flavobacteriaceae bacterium]MDB4738296.1 queuosine precursor transporter [Flavobacteriaceae bacterium]MDC0959890.1 queuosine precursor transporter [Flavobacteriaceae bacterium]
MNQKDKALADQIFLFLAALFITSLVVSNLIFQKFFFWYPVDTSIFGIPLFELSVGILPYPITFLITDLISEIFGKKKANQVVVAGIFASFFSIGILLVADAVPAIAYSPINDATFNQVFSLSPLAVLASMIAYLLAQFVDIRIYHFWKKITQGKHLWLRNNFSTFASQFLDTFTVILLLCFFGVLSWDMFLGLVVSGFIFKVLVAVIDTPFLYLFVYLIRKRFGLKIGEEIRYELK